MTDTTRFPDPDTNETPEQTDHVVPLAPDPSLNAGRTVHGIPPHARAQAADPVLHVTGCVHQPLELRPIETIAMPRIETSAIPVSSHYRGPETTAMSGVRLSDLLGRIAPDPDAAWMRISAGPYGVAVPFTEADRVVLCDQIDGQPIPAEAGGPWRLWFADRSYNMGVKWVDQIEVCREEPDDSAIRIAEARERARQFHRLQSNADN
jgi:DMSO/TMAO reductase YedYZ molybdopterin-dependent catalytic subunit